MGLRDLIEAKQRRTAKVPILVGDPSAAAAEVRTFGVALMQELSAQAKKKEAGQRVTKADKEREQKLRSQVEEAQAKHAAAVVEVEVQSLPEDEWEACLAHLSEDDRESYELGKILGPLLAASCTDPELQDAEWWTAQLAGKAWTDGDKGAISRALLELNVFAPQFEALGKG